MKHNLIENASNVVSHAPPANGSRWKILDGLDIASFTWDVFSGLLEGVFELLSCLSL